MFNSTFCMVLITCVFPGWDNDPRRDTVIITGRVTCFDSVLQAKVPVQSAAVHLKGTRLGTITDTAAKFNFRYIGNQRLITLIFSYPGFYEQKVKVNLDNNTSNINLGDIELRSAHWIGRNIIDVSDSALYVSNKAKRRSFPNTFWGRITRPFRK